MRKTVQECLENCKEISATFASNLTLPLPTHSSLSYLFKKYALEAE